MSRLTNHATRAGVSAVGVAVGLMVLASTAQTPDGFTQASFDGPLSIFGNSAPDPQGDLLAIGDGTVNARDLAAILNGPTPAIDGNSPFPAAAGAAVEPSGIPGSSAPAADPLVGVATSKQSLGLSPKSVVDSQGRVDCTGSVSCLTDPATNVTTVTYPDGIVALVQKINDMTVVAYQSVADALPSELKTLLPPVSVPTMQQAAAPMPAASVPTIQTPTTPDPGASPDPSAAAVPPQISASTVRPRVVVAPAPSSGPGPARRPAQSPALTIPDIKPVSPLDVVKDAITSVVDAVTGNHTASRVTSGSNPTVSPEPASAPASASDSASSSGSASGKLPAAGRNGQ